MRSLHRWSGNAVVLGWGILLLLLNPAWSVPALAGTAPTDAAAKGGAAKASVMMQHSGMARKPKSSSGQVDNICPPASISKDRIPFLAT